MRKKEERRAKEIVRSTLPSPDQTELVCHADARPAAGISPV